MNFDRLSAALAAHVIPGAVAIVGNRAGIIDSFVTGADAEGKPLAADSVFQLASMTKAVVSVAAMQLVEAGKLSLDAPLALLLPDLADPQVITGFDDDGRVRTRPAVRPITLRHLLAHTAGFGYDFASPELARARGGVMPAPGSLDSLKSPLLFDPGDGWAYGVSTDWVGLAVEAASSQRLDAYVAEHITGPLGMADTVFDLGEAQKPRFVTNSARSEDGTVMPFPINIGGGTRGEFISGGAGLLGTASDYLRFVRMLLGGGRLDGVRLLTPETVAEMGHNQIGTLRAGMMETTMPALSARVEWFPDMLAGWGLGFLINPETGPDGRAAGSLAWAGICNTFFWIDPASDRAAVLLMQLLPFGDPGALAALSGFERDVYS